MAWTLPPPPPAPSPHFGFALSSQIRSLLCSARGAPPLKAENAALISASIIVRIFNMFKENIMAALSSKTKAQLIEHIAAQERQLKELVREIDTLRQQLHAPKPAAPQYRAGPADHQAYWNYVRSTREAQRAAGKAVISYKTFPDWFANHA